jgi:hypothetical protein
MEAVRSIGMEACPAFYMKRAMLGVVRDLGLISTIARSDPHPGPRESITAVMYN